VSRQPPRVRYVIPSYNQGRYLREAVQSLLDQDYPCLDVIVCDGRSSDESVAVLQSFHDSRLRWLSEPDGGQTDAILKGLDYPGEPFRYFNWLGSDDVLADAAAVSRLVECAEATGADVVYGEGEYIDSDGVPTGRYALGDANPESLQHGCPICQPSALIRVAALRRAGGLRRRWHSVMDYDLWLRLADAGATFVRRPEVVSRYRIHKDSKTVAGRAVTYREIFELFAERGRRVQWGLFEGAFRECVWSARTGREHVPPGWRGWPFRTVRKLCWLACRLAPLQRRVPLLFRPPKCDVLAFTRSYQVGAA
jgi:glycosyltransferase involved in cell wall biosynthesis